MSLPPGGTLRTKKTVSGYPYTPPESGGRCFIQLFRMAEPAGQAVGYDILVEFLPTSKTCIWKKPFSSPAVSVPAILTLRVA